MREHKKDEDKKTQTTTVYIDSEIRTGGTNENPTVNLSPYGLINVNTFRVKELYLPFSYYVFNSTANTISWTEDTSPSPTTYTITLPVGNYTSSSMIAALQTQMSDASVANNYAVTISDLTFKITFTATSKAGGATPAAVFTFNLAPSTALYYLGFNGVTTDPTSTTSGLTEVITSPHTVRLNGPIAIYIRSRKLNTILSTTAFRAGVKDGIVASVLPAYLPGGAQIIEPRSGLETYKCNQGSIYEIDLELLDATGARLGGPEGLNGTPWHIAFIFEHGIS